MTRLVTARELADMLGLSPATLLDAWQAGKLPGYKVGRAVRFDPDEILTLCRRPGAEGRGTRENANAPAHPDSPFRGTNAVWPKTPRKNGGQ
jgi:excisionase family DNA binding protein